MCGGCARWSDSSAACPNAPVWQPLEWMMSSWYDVQARRADGRWLYPHQRSVVNPFRVGNLLCNLTGDRQSAIIARGNPRAGLGWSYGRRVSRAA